jgi:hypothetical protein
MREEAVARALVPALCGSQEDEHGNDLPDKQFDDLPPDWQARHLEYARAAITAMRALEPRASSDGVVKALKAADDALRNYACHGGPSVPCIRSPEQCRSECGKPAGDALLLVESALQSQPSSNEARLREALEWVSAEIERYGVGLVPELSIVCRWLAGHFRDPETIDAALSNEENGSERYVGDSLHDIAFEQRRDAEGNG